MKSFTAAMLATGLLLLSGAAQAQSTVPVRGHVTRSGTYVPPHYRTTPNTTKTDNWTSKPNTNPYNGRVGTVDPYAPPKPYRAPKKGW